MRASHHNPIGTWSRQRSHRAQRARLSKAAGPTDSVATFPHAERHSIETSAPVTRLCQALHCRASANGIHGPRLPTTVQGQETLFHPSRHRTHQTSYGPFEADCSRQGKQPCETTHSTAGEEKKGRTTFHNQTTFRGRPNNRTPSMSYTALKTLASTGRLHRSSRPKYTRKRRLRLTTLRLCYTL